ncbi:MAG: FAD-dependent thymidylate synthase, partial [Thermoplasmata archaeon]|nr:FAD-dependent thymidylate synthase [Thermoplasmata archaeon]
VVPKEDARYVLPNACFTNITVTMNARELWHFFNLRCCRRAQWEIRLMAWRMLEAVQKVAPILFADAGPRCLLGPCPEGEYTCGRPYHRGGIPSDEEILSGD